MVKIYQEKRLKKLYAKKLSFKKCDLKIGGCLSLPILLYRFACPRSDREIFIRTMPKIANYQEMNQPICVFAIEYFLLNGVVSFFLFFPYKIEARVQLELSTSSDGITDFPKNYKF